jgi:hypothetical protein
MPDAGTPLRATAVFTTDPRPGCGTTTAQGVDQIVQTLNLTGSATAHVTAHLISTGTGRRDVYLVVDGGLVTASLGRTDFDDWYDHHLAWSGSFAAGSHTIKLVSGTAGTFGCGAQWGNISTLILQQ